MGKKKTRLFLILGALLSFGCGRFHDEQEVASEFPLVVDFPELVALAEKYSLPFPPKDAPLVLATQGGTRCVGNSSTSHDPGIYRPAFLLKNIDDQKKSVFLGLGREIVESKVKHRPAIRAFSFKQPKAKLKGYVAQFNNFESFLAAVYLAQRGERERAHALIVRVHESEYLNGVNAMENIGALRSDYRQFLARCLYQYFYEKTLDEGSDWASLHQKLVQLQEEFPVLFSEREEDFYAMNRLRFIEDLGREVHARHAPDDSVEGLLVKWGSLKSRMRHLGYFDEKTVEEDQPARAIFEKGLVALPELQRLAEDQRLTRHVDSAFMKKPEQRFRLGDLAQKLIKEMKGSLAEEKDEVPALERDFFEKAAVTWKSDKIVSFHEVPLRILSKRHPSSLLEFCSKPSSDFSEECHFFSLSEAIVKASLPREQKVTALSQLALRLKSISQKRGVLQNLAKFDQAACIALVRPLLAQFPKDVEGPYWLSEIANFTHVIAQLEDDGIWTDYLEVAQRASVGLRMEMMNPLNYRYLKDRNRARRVAFLAAFLDDDTLRKLSSSSHQYSGPCAGFTFPKIEVRNFVATKIASLLSMPDEPTEFWKKQDWAQFRARVEERLKSEELPDLSRR